MATFDPTTPDRPDFGFFEKILGREIPRPATAAEAHAKIEALLRETYSKKPYDLVRAAGMSRIRSFWNSTGNRPEIIKESMDFIVSGLWERAEDGTPSKSRTNTDPEAGSSSSAIKYYRAKEHGVVEYLGKHIGWIISDYVHVLADRSKNVSLEHLEEVGVSLASDHRFVRQQSQVAATDRDDDEHHTDARTRLTETSKEREASMRAELNEDGRDIDGQAEDIDPRDLRRSVEIDDDATAYGEPAPKYRPLSAFAKIALRGPSRPDMEMFEGELNRQVVLAPDPATRETQLRGLAQEVIQKSCKGMPEYEDMVAAVDDWAPFEKPFQSFFPEVVEWINERDRERTSTMTPAQQAAAAAPTMLAAIPETEILAGLDFDTQAEVSDGLVEQSRLWRVHATPDVLASADRPDYKFLRTRLGYSHAPLRDEEARIKDMRGLAAEFVNGFFGAAPFLRGRFLDTIKDWDPRESLFTEEITRTIARIVEQDKLPTNEVSTSALSFFSACQDPVVSPSATAAVLESTQPLNTQGVLFPDPVSS